MKWLGGLVEAAGVNIFKEFGGADLIYEGDGIGGVITEDKGLDKNGKPKSNFAPGYELHSKDYRARGRHARIAHETTRERETTRQHKPANLRHRDQGIMGRTTREDQAGICGAHSRVAHLHQNVRRWLDLWPLG